MELAQVVIMVFDAHEDVTDQDLNLLGKVFRTGKGRYSRI